MLQKSVGKKRKFLSEMRKIYKHEVTMTKVIIYSDGGCKPNPGKGGYGTVLLYEEHRKEFSAGYKHTTNNRMEILGAVVGLEALKFPCEVVVFSDSRYVVDAIQKGWVKRWRANKWMRNKKERAENTDLWERLWQMIQKHKVEFRWVRGHAGNKENERCDKLATAAMRSGDLLVDTNYVGG